MCRMLVNTTCALRTDQVLEVQNNFAATKLEVAKVPFGADKHHQTTNKPRSASTAEGVDNFTSCQ